MQYYFGISNLANEESFAVSVLQCLALNYKHGQAVKNHMARLKRHILHEPNTN
jgi:hypothetical protein